MNASDDEVYVGANDERLRVYAIDMMTDDDGDHMKRKTPMMVTMTTMALIVHPVTYCMGMIDTPGRSPFVIKKCSFSVDL